MPKAFFMVRAVVEAPLRQKFDAWYADHHLPMALAAFQAEKAWRLWSRAEPGVHYAVYRFADGARLDAALKAPSFKELGYDNMDIELWYGIFGPAKLPPEIADKWQRELPAILAMPDVKDGLMRQGMVPLYAPAADLGALTKADIARWRTVVEKAGIQPD